MSLRRMGESIVEFPVYIPFHTSLTGCVDDLRISGHRMPLPPAVNNTPWGQASLYQRVDEDCNAPPVCANVTCRPPLTCIDTWRSHHCGSVPSRVRCFPLLPESPTTVSFLVLFVNILSSSFHLPMTLGVWIDSQDISSRYFFSLVV